MYKLTGKDTYHILVHKEDKQLNLEVVVDVSTVNDVMIGRVFRSRKKRWWPWNVVPLTLIWTLPREEHENF